jgi:hypothetical protein
MTQLSLFPHRGFGILWAGALLEDRSDGYLGKTFFAADRDRAHRMLRKGTPRWMHGARVVGVEIHSADGLTTETDTFLILEEF